MAEKRAIQTGWMEFNAPNPQANELQYTETHETVEVTAPATKIETNRVNDATQRDNAKGNDVANEQERTDDT